MPNLHTSPTLFIASDYSGEHANADYQTISIVITDVNAINDWNQHRLRVRERYLSDGRRMSFKQLRDQRRWQALGPFLSAADKLRGLSATVAIHSSIDTLFTGIDPLDLSNRDFAKFSHWNTHEIRNEMQASQQYRERKSILDPRMTERSTLPMRKISEKLTRQRCENA